MCYAHAPTPHKEHDHYIPPHGLITIKIIRQKNLIRKHTPIHAHKHNNPSQFFQLFFAPVQSKISTGVLCLNLGIHILFYHISPEDGSRKHMGMHWNSNSLILPYHLWSAGPKDSHLYQNIHNSPQVETSLPLLCLFRPAGSHFLHTHTSEATTVVTSCSGTIAYCSFSLSSWISQWFPAVTLSK